MAPDINNAESGAVKRRGRRTKRSPKAEIAARYLKAYVVWLTKADAHVIGRGWGRGQPIGEVRKESSKPRSRRRQ